MPADILSLPCSGDGKESLAAFRLSSLDIIQPSSSWDNMEAPMSHCCVTQKGLTFWSGAAGIYHESTTLKL